MYGCASLSPRGDVHTRCMRVGERPMHQVQVQVIQPQVGQRLPECRDDVFLGVLVVPKLGRHPQFLTPNAARHHVLQGGADPILVAVYCRTIKMAIPYLRRPAHGLRHLFMRSMVGTKGAQSDRRHLGACIQYPLRHGARVYTASTATIPISPFVGHATGMTISSLTTRTGFRDMPPTRHAAIRPVGQLP